MAGVTFEWRGLKKAVRQLERLQSPRDIGRIQRRAFNKALTFLAAEARRRAPVGETKQLRRSIGKRFRKQRTTGIITAMIGVNVGKTGNRFTRYGAARVAGTGERTQASTGRATGRVQGTAFVSEAMRSGQSQAVRLLSESVKAGIKELRSGG